MWDIVGTWKASKKSLISKSFSSNSMLTQKKKKKDLKQSNILFEKKWY